MIRIVKNRVFAKPAIPCFFFLLFFFVFAPCHGAHGNTTAATLRIDRLIDNGGYILADGQAPIAAADEEKLFVPASILKIVTALGALHILGPDFRFHTEFYLSPDNDLYIKGFGDPFLTSEEITNKVRLCKRSAPQSEPVVGQARWTYIEKSFWVPEGSDRAMGRQEDGSGPRNVL
ncbi:MAG: hypothetical protein BM485_09135 [Desulfobulbaceae bacterium DB1]|nr:MAG: hypothetical protein BM485_09135 [Desulfobulbaceae bacterium DB1]